MDSPFKRIDHALAQYYKNCGRNDYFDENNQGKFRVFVNINEFDEDEVELELQNATDCLYVDMDEEFPLIHEGKEDDNYTRNKQIYDIINYCYKYGVAPNEIHSTQQIPPLQIANENKEDRDELNIAIFTNDELKEIEDETKDILDDKQKNKSIVSDTNTESEDVENSDQDTIFTEEELEEITNELFTLSQTSKNTQTRIKHTEQQMDDNKFNGNNIGDSTDYVENKQSINDEETDNNDNNEELMNTIYIRKRN